MSGNTVPALLVAAAASKPNAVAIRERTAGLWREVTWAAYLDEASRFGMGLVALGVKAGDRVAILSENHPSWVVADVGAQGIGAAVLGIDPDVSPDHVATLLRHFGVTTVIVGDEEQFDKVTESRSRLPTLRTVVVVNTRGIRHLDDASGADSETVITYARLLEAGASTATEWAGYAAAVEPSSVGAIAADIRSDGSVEEHLLHQAELVAGGESAVRAVGAGPHDEVVAVMSLANSAERAMSGVGSLVAGYRVHFPQSGQLLMRGLADVQPTFMHAPAALLAQIANDARRRAESTPAVKRRGIATTLAVLLLLLPGFLVKGFGGSKALSGRLANIGLILGAAVWLFLYHRPDALMGTVPGLRRFAFTKAMQRRARPAGRGISDLRVFRAGLVIASAASIVICAILRTSTPAWLRILIVVALLGGWILFGIFSGLAVHPFIRRRYGLGRIRSVVTGERPVASDVQSFFSTIGVPLSTGTLDSNGFLIGLEGVRPVVGGGGSK